MPARLLHMFMSYTQPRARWASSLLFELPINRYAQGGNDPLNQLFTLKNFNEHVKSLSFSNLYRYSREMLEIMACATRTITGDKDDVGIKVLPVFRVCCSEGHMYSGVLQVQGCYARRGSVATTRSLWIFFSLVIGKPHSSGSIHFHVIYIWSRKW